MRKLLFLNILFLLSFVINEIFAATPRPEYPRPQFERTDWINLNGEWTFEFDFVGSGLDRGYSSAAKFDKKIIVPFAPESKLSGVGYTDFINHIWYQKSITVPSNWSNKNILLNFGAVYYTSEVYIDGKFVGRHFGGSSSFSFDITKFVEAGKTHSLVVYASSDVRTGKQSAGKQSLQYASHDCDYTRTTGIWQTVWMEAVNPFGLKRTQVITDIDQKQIVIHPQFYKENNHSLKVILKDGDKVVNTQNVKASNNSIIVIPVKNMKTWSPESPFLYNLTYQVLDQKGAVLDEVNSYVGMRKVHIEGNKIFLNNEPYYQRLVLDQGFYPDGIWTAPSDEALKNDIVLSMQAGFNGARLHQKVFEERFYYWADKLGYITWGESASWGMDANDIEVARNFLAEWSECIIRDRNHPSLLIWTPMNEQWWPDNVQYPRFAEDLYNVTKQLDPTRPVNNSSGGQHIKTDIWTVHNYEQNPEKLRDIIYKDGVFFQTPMMTKKKSTNIGFNDVKDVTKYIFPLYDGKMPYVIDEVGGIKWVKDQEKQLKDSRTESWGYGEAPKSMEEFYTRLEGQIDAVLSLSKYVWGYCYTQLTDVEQEQNGVYFYDRSSKFDMKRIHSIFSKTPDQVKQVD
ncbi:beta-glucuronidase [Dysgonomonas sp. Marseille-P4677]|uniref:glycoside hydrolase family 2 protein n=1 Tax=Dysgonomonas sp. Marseille-P4677 TaxID=2364790 RepID=UPI0019112CC1|nr:sugar-binding domain-containing protein [Dysgonomonas sp. Marseille-P4677]MBK5720906.1 beta-glucuronidase [Dysgonomonas sp. Marseille-P4677]